METNSFQSETMNFMASQFQVATERLVNVLCVAVGIKRTNCDLWHFYANDRFMCFFHAFVGPALEDCVLTRL